MERGSWPGILSKCGRLDGPRCCDRLTDERQRADRSSLGLAELYVQWLAWETARRKSGHARIHA